MKRSRFQQRLHDDSGVVAIIVALSMSTFLLGFAALAVDAGTAFAAKAELQSVADRVALATASALPTIEGAGGARVAFVQAWQQICQDKGRSLWPSDVCGSTADTRWAFDTKRSNGEVEFLNPPDPGTAPLAFVLPTLPGALPASATAVRIALPPSTVEFGFGSAIGIDSTRIQQNATARVGTSLGAGILPFAATQSDVGNGQFCVIDPAVPPVTPTGSNYSTFLPSRSTPPRLRIESPSPAAVAFDPDAAADATTPVTLTLVLRDFFTSTQKLKLWFKTSNVPIEVPDPARALTADGLFGWRFTVRIPKQDPGVNLQLWVTGEQRIAVRWRSFTSDSVQLNYQGRPVGDPDPCTLPQADGRGFADLARTSGSNPLEDNVRRGPQVQLYPESLLAPVTNILGDLCVQRVFQPQASCVTSNQTPGFNSALKDGLFKDDGSVNARLKGDCGNGTTDSGGNGGVDASRLVGAGASQGLVDTSHGSSSALRSSIINGGASAGTRGWISGAALRCPRMAVLPVISNTPSPLDVVLSGGKEITGFVYLWIDGINADRGLSWNGGRLRSVSGYVIDPKYLPPVVAGSGVVGPYLGGTMPKEATLICDLRDQQEKRCADAA